MEYTIFVFEVEDINSAILRLKKDGATVLGDGKAKIGAHGKPVIFLHPKDFNGTLIELEEV